MSKTEPKVAIVHDWLVTYAGGDRVVDCMHHVFPNAVIYTLVYDKKKMPAWFQGYDIRTTWVQKLPFATKLYKNLLPLMPGAFEALDLSAYDRVLSSSSSCSAPPPALARARACFPCSPAGLGQNWPNTIYDFSFSFYSQIRKFVENRRKLIKLRDKFC